jgi:hypothetical protein
MSNDRLVFCRGARRENQLMRSQPPDRNIKNSKMESRPKGRFFYF